MGDLNGDFRNDHADFVLFKTAFETANGTGSLAASMYVPEPASALLALWIAIAGASSRKQLQRAKFINSLAV